MGKAYFVTGTDTDVGKTYVTAAMLRQLAAEDLRVFGLKPVAAGCVEQGGALVNEDALQLQAASSVALPYGQVNPVALASPIAPHIAAKEEGRQLSLTRLAGLCRGALMTPHDVAFVEGAGGWLVPLNEREMLSGLAKELNLEAILVVGLRLGCINHALLTALAIRQQGVRLAGWVGNQCQPEEMARQAENIETLQQAMPAPCLGIIPWNSNVGPKGLSQSVIPPMELGLLLPSR